MSWYKYCFIIIQTLVISLNLGLSNAFGVVQPHQNHGIEKFQHTNLKSLPGPNLHFDDVKRSTSTTTSSTRRDVLKSAIAGTGSLICAAAGLFPSASNAAVGTLPEFEDSNAILQGITINVVDKGQQDNMIAFLENGFDFKVLRKRITGSIEETWLGFGPEQLSIPEDFEFPVSSFGQYGGHASIHLKYDSQATDILYRPGDNAPGDNIAFLQVGVPSYRISQMVANGGNVLDAYGLVNVISPSGLPMRGIVGISPDPIMFIAINCLNVQQSKEFYERLGFVEQDYPFSRLSKGTTIFEPPKPKGAVYMAPSRNCIGVLLQPIKKKKNLTPNPVVESLNIVYTPSSSSNDDGASSGGSDGDSSSSSMVLKDPSGVPVSFMSASAFSQLEKITR